MPSDPSYFQLNSFCGAYILGITYSFISSEPLNGYNWSVPTDVELRQLTKIVSTYFNLHSDYLDYNASGLVADALSEAFPCPGCADISLFI